MDAGHIVFLIILGAMLIVTAVLAMRSIYAQGQLAGTRKAVYEMTRGISTHYEHDDQPLPERVAKCVDEMNASITRAPNAREKCHAYQNHFWGLGNVMGEAAWQDGFEAGHRFIAPKSGEVRVDLAIEDLMEIRRLADFGFENMIWNRDSPFTFKDEKEAEAATHAIERFEFHIPKERRDPSDPYAHSFNRQTMIWRRWPSNKQEP
jgi:hypothetical protein